MSEELESYELNEARHSQRLAAYFAIGGGALALAGITADLDVAIGPFLHIHTHHLSEVTAGTGIAMLGFWMAKYGVETFLDSWQRRKELEKKAE